MPRPSRANSASSRASNSNRNVSNANHDDSDPRYVVPRPLMRIVRDYSHEPGTFAYQLRFFDETYRDWILYAERYPPVRTRMERMADKMVRWMREWLRLESRVVAMSDAFDATRSQMRSKFRFMKKVHDHYANRMLRVRDYRDGAALISFFWVFMVMFPFVMSIDDVRARLPKEDTRVLRALQTGAIRELRYLRQKLWDASIDVPDTVRVDETRRYANAGRSKTNAWVARVQETNVPFDVPEGKKTNIVTLEPLTRGVPLRCGHWIAKSSLKEMAKSGATLRCPFCYEAIYKRNLTRQ